MSEWMESAVCRQLDPELFFDPACEAEAVMVCREFCPVLDECREWALRSMPDGACGGMTDRERAQVRAERGTTTDCRGWRAELTDAILRERCGVAQRARRDRERQAVNR